MSEFPYGDDGIVFNNLSFRQCNINEDLIIKTAKLMKTLGLAVSILTTAALSSPPLNFTTQDAGYTRVNLDDCYSEKERSPSGDIVASKYHQSYR